MLWKMLRALGPYWVLRADFQRERRELRREFDRIDRRIVQFAMPRNDPPAEQAS